MAAGSSIEVYLEAGRRRVFACAFDWPGWARSTRDEAGAVAALDEYRTRYQLAIGEKLPPADLKVVLRIPGDATTDFGAPGIEPPRDRKPLATAELQRLLRRLDSCWSAFEETAAKHRRTRLATGPRGGGRQVPAMRSHVIEAAKAYVRGVGATTRSIGEDVAALRTLEIETLTDRARGEPAPENPRRTKPFWSPRYAIRRAAWHLLDHAWEIEDRSAR